MTQPQHSARATLTMIVATVSVLVLSSSPALAQYRAWYLDDNDWFEEGDVSHGNTKLLPPDWACGLRVDDPSDYLWVGEYEVVVDQGDPDIDMIIWIDNPATDCPKGFTIEYLERECHLPACIGRALPGDPNRRGRALGRQGRRLAALRQLQGPQRYHLLPAGDRVVDRRGERIQDGERRHRRSAAASWCARSDCRARRSGGAIAAPAAHPHRGASPCPGRRPRGLGPGAGGGIPAGAARRAHLDRLLRVAGATGPLYRVVRGVHDRGSASRDERRTVAGCPVSHATATSIERAGRRRRRCRHREVTAAACARVRPSRAIHPSRRLVRGRV